MAGASSYIRLNNTQQRISGLKNPVLSEDAELAFERVTAHYELCQEALAQLTDPNVYDSSVERTVGLIPLSPQIIVLEELKTEIGEFLVDIALYEIFGEQDN